jgi:hypothetical protein
MPVYLPDFTELVLLNNLNLIHSNIIPNELYWKKICKILRKELYISVLKKASTAELAYGFNLYKNITIECKVCSIKRHFYNEMDVYNFIEKHRKCEEN